MMDRSGMKMKAGLEKKTITVGDVVKFQATGPGGSYFRRGKVLAVIRAGDDALAALPKEYQDSVRGKDSATLKGGHKRIALVNRVAVFVSSETDKSWKKSEGKIFFPISGNIV